jgi:hypothetical protein
MPRVARTWNTTTATVLTMNSSDTRERGAWVCAETHSGMPISISPKWRDKIPDTSTMATYGRSRRACQAADGARPVPTTGTWGSRRSTTAQPAYVAASTTIKVLYAVGVSRCSATAARAAPRVMPMLVIDRRYARA